MVMRVSQSFVPNSLEPGSIVYLERGHETIFGRIKHKVFVTEKDYARSDSERDGFVVQQIPITSAGYPDLKYRKMPIIAVINRLGHTEKSVSLHGQWQKWNRQDSRKWPPTPSLYENKSKN